MTAKRLNSGTLEEGPLEKRGRLETIEDDVEAELDDEVEKELREFEQLHSGLLGTEKGKPGTMNRESVEEENAGGSDMELDDLDQEVAEARKKTQTVKKWERTPVLDETVPSSNIRILPDALVEEDLIGDDLIEKSTMPEDEEEACLDVENQDSRASDPLITPSNTDVVKPLELSISEQSLAKQVEELTAQAQAMSQSPEPYSDDSSNDPDFPSPGRRKSRSRARSKRSSKSSRSEPKESPKKKQRADRELTPKSLEKVVKHGPPLRLRGKSSEPPKQNATETQPSPEQSSRSPMAKDLVEESVSQRHLQANGTHRAPEQVLKSHVRSLDQDPKFRGTIDRVSKPGDHIKKVPPSVLQAGKGERLGSTALTALKAIDFDKTDTMTNTRILQRDKYQPKVVMQAIPLGKSQIRFSTTQDDLRKSPSPSLGNAQPSKHQANSTPAPPSEQQDREEHALSTAEPDDSPQAVVPTKSFDEPKYCVVERVMHRRFKSNFTLDHEKLEMMGADRPAIQCPELHAFTHYYESHTWLVACNELKRFFCWPCLFFATKMTWSVHSDENVETEIGKEINKHSQSPVHQESIKQMDELAMRNKSSIIKTLLTNKFAEGTWSETDREAIILKGRPQPVLEGMADVDEKNEKTAFKKFYDEVKWICGCANTRKFYCWPCLLYSSEWCRSGKISSLGTAISEHETEGKHMEACLELGKREFDLWNQSGVNKEENEEKTQSFVTNLVELFCAEKKKINNAELSTIDFLDTLELMSEYNGKLRILMDGKSQNAKIGLAQAFAGAIQESVESFMKGGILEEMRKSNFISLIFDHSSGVSSKAILSVIARYVDESGRVHERFVKLLNVGYNTPSKTLVDEFFQVITELQCRSSLVGFTYDGYLVKPGDITEFNEKVQKLCPNAKFFHYTEHTFKRILKQTLCHVPLCRNVLQKVKELAGFFENNPAARKGLTDIVSAAEKSDTEGIWRSPNFITTVFLYHAVIIEIMESICKAPLTWKVRTVLQAASFMNFFKDPANRFFVTLMARIFDHVEDLSTELKKEVEMEELKTIASRTALKLQKLGRNFDYVLDSACSHLLASNQDEAREAMSALRDKFSNVIRLAVKLVKNRVFGLEAGYFKISKEAPKLSVTNSIKLDGQYLVLQSDTLPSNFNSEKLSNELQFFHKTTLAGSAFSEIIAHMIDYNMVHVLPELFKFLQLALTIPKTQYDSTIPAVRRISAYIEGKKDVNSVDALFWMEKAFLTNLQEDPNVYTSVTDRVMSITKKGGFDKFVK